jgi:hypothetical protein
MWAPDPAAPDLSLTPKHAEAQRAQGNDRLHHRSAVGTADGNERDQRQSGKSRRSCRPVALNGTFIQTGA